MYFQIFVDAAGEWRWRLWASNGRIIADSGEGYKNKADCLHGIGLVQSSSRAEIRQSGGTLGTLGL